MKGKFILKVLVATIIFVVVSQTIHTLGAFFGMKYYLMPEYFPVWSKIMMPEPGPPPMKFTLMSIGVSVLTGLIYSLLYYTIMESVPGKNGFRRGISLGLILFFVAGLPNLLSMVLLINLPLQLVIFWLVETFLISIIAGTLMGIVIK